MRSLHPIILLAALATSATSAGQSLSVTLADKVAQPLPDAAIYDNFGSGMALSGTTLVVGAEHDDEAGTNAGAAYVYELVAGDWIFRQKLWGSDTTDYDRFGSAAVVDGDTLAIAADWDHDAGAQAGSVYVFVRQGGVWVEQAHLTPGDWDPFDHFGYSMALEGDRLVIGAHEPGWSQPSTYYEDHGTVYVFERIGSAWSEAARLRASDGADYDYLGASVALAGDLIVAAAPGNDGPAKNAGAVYVFSFDGLQWNQVAKLWPSTAAQNQSFGSDLALAGTTLVVGAKEESPGSPYSGAAYVFEGAGATWSELQRLAPVGLADYDRFGASLAIDADRLVVSAVESDLQGTDLGAAYVYRRFGGAWHEQAVLLPAGAALDDQLGNHVAIEGQRVVTCSPFADPEFWLPDAGAAWVFELEQSVEHHCPASPHSGGVAARLDARGSLGLAANDLELAVFDGPASQLGLMIYGPDAVQVPFGNGFRCVGGGVVRLLPGFKLDAQGSMVRALDFTQPPLSAGAGQVLTGSTWSFQAWFRDAPAGPGATDFSDAVRLTFQP